MVPRQHIPHARRQRQHPLPYGHVRKHILDQVGGALGHPPAAAARTEAAPLGGKSYKPLVPARRTSKSGEASCEASTRQKVFECPLHKPREALPVTSLRGLRAKRLVVIADNPVEYLLIRAARPIDKGRERHGTVEGKDRARGVVAITGRRLRQRASTIAVTAYADGDLDAGFATQPLRDAPVTVARGPCLELVPGRDRPGQGRKFGQVFLREQHVDGCNVLLQPPPALCAWDWDHVGPAAQHPRQRDLRRCHPVP